MSETFRQLHLEREQAPQVSRIYHGTSSRLLEQILVNGLCRRGRRKSNWGRNPSSAQFVYLTTTYPGYYAHKSLEGNALLLIFEIEFSLLNIENVYPDEDFLSEAGKGLPDARKLMLWNKDRWSSSLDNLGSLAYRGDIPPEAFTRYVLLDPKVRPHIANDLLQPSISRLNHRLHGSYYRDMLRWLFDGDIELPMFTRGKETAATFSGVSPRETALALEHLEKESNSRDGIRVVNLKNSI